ncbi:MAG: 50S ribosomal protein L24 [Berkelbacteria bacterium GW2011_GWA1_36_9]|uniref:Large ribosomal subunit protein uL24 n=1 Tax=Berkelbacteria bacterium GW2011_GWA1_36_9 TaxID=1618331 RepID=A0A0G0FWJ9_9BACT|nr:MAG: 50S ribosomal protein L24 [Berkelbacteria bacterium GW2011_GWA1_36_9]
MKLKKGDTVLIIAGKDKGKRANIEKSVPQKNKIVVTGVNISKHHLKSTRKNPHGGIMDKLAPIDVSNAILVCPHCSKPSRIGYKIIQDKNTKKKARICKSCQGDLS